MAPFTVGLVAFLGIRRIASIRHGMAVVSRMGMAALVRVNNRSRGQLIMTGQMRTPDSARDHQRAEEDKKQQS